MIFVSRDGWLVKWANFAPWMEDSFRSQTSLCAFFWRTFVFATLSNIVVAAFIVAFSPIALPVWVSQGIKKARDRREMQRDPNGFRKAQLAKARRLQAKLDRLDAFMNRVKRSLFVRGLMTVKSKVCPLVVIK